MKLLLIVLFLISVSLCSPVRLPMGRIPRPLRRIPGQTAFLRRPLPRRSNAPWSEGRLYKTYPLRGNWTQLALWYMTIDVGSTNQTFHVQVDTGSSDVGIPDAKCNCGHHLDNPWSPSTDPNASPVPCSGTQLTCGECDSNQCGYTISYADGSGYTAELYSDTVVFGSAINGGILLKQQYIGDIVSEVTPNGPFEPTAVDGIAGFAQQFLSEVNAPTLMDTLTAQLGSSSCPFIFSMCGDVDHSGGVLTVCGEGQHHTGKNQYTPMVQYDQGFYNIHVVDMAINGQRLNVASHYYNDGGAIVDSGTTFLLLPDKAWSAIRALFEKNCSSNNLHGVCDVSSGQSLFDGACYRMTSAQVAAFPSLSIVAGSSNSITVSIPNHAYLVPGFCSDVLAYSFSMTNIGGSGTIIGDPIMISNEVTYDVVNKRMGFAPKAGNCVF